MTRLRSWSYVLFISLTTVLVVDAFTYNEPNFLPFTRPYNVFEYQLTELAIADIECTNPGDSCLCNIKEMTPVNGPFTVWRKDTLSKFQVFYTGVAQGGKLSFKTTPTYFLLIECRNELGTNTTQRILEIDVQQNKPPVIGNIKYPRDSIVLNAMRPYVPGDNIYQVSATDPESDGLTYSISTNPVVDYFTIDTDGYINIKTDLRSATVKNTVITVSVSDGISTINNFEITVNLTSMNTRPVIKNLPATVKFPENTPAGTTLIILTLEDPDIFDITLVPTCSVVPNGEEYKFTYESGTRKIKLSSLTNTLITQPLDYENINKYTITCVYTDGYLDSINDTLTLLVENVNEAPTFDEVAYYCDLYESGPGVSTCDLDAVIIDPEGDTITSIGFLSGNNLNRFRYDRSTTTITFNVDYDVDQAAMPTNVNLTLQAVDVYGAKSTVPVYIKISDVNDNTCTFGATSTNTFKADQGTSLGSLGNFIATDNDLTSPNNLVSYEVISALPADSTNYIAAYSDGSLAYIGLIPETNHGKSYSLIVRCKDGGSPPRTAQGTIVLTYQTTTTTSTTTTTTPTTTTTSTTTTTTTTAKSTNIFDNDAFVAIFAILMSLLILGLLVGLYFLLRFCGLCGGAGAGAAGAPGGICGPNNGCNNFCCPKKEVEPVEDYFNTEVRTNNNYRDPYWKTGDHYETGTGYNPEGDKFAKPIEGGFKRLALPPPPRGTSF